jgi:hypothetical protein
VAHRGKKYFNKSARLKQVSNEQIHANSNATLNTLVWNIYGRATNTGPEEDISNVV